MQIKSTGRGIGVMFDVEEILIIRRDGSIPPALVTRILEEAANYQAVFEVEIELTFTATTIIHTNASTHQHAEDKVRGMFLGAEPLDGAHITVESGEKQYLLDVLNVDGIDVTDVELEA